MLKKSFRPFPPDALAVRASIAAIISAFLLIGCAGQVFPPGGPADTVPPTIIKTFPDSNAVHVNTTYIDLEFSEYVRRETVEPSIFISPYVGDLDFEWSGTGVRIHFSNPLKPNKTYVVNVGTDVQDVNAGNRMAEGYTLAFTTGDSIDHGFISGRVFDDKPEGIMIFAYQLDSIKADTLNPAHTNPDYIMQTGKAGRFTLSNIAWGTYRVFAIRDEYHNLLYDREIDQFGVATGDVRVDQQHPRVQELWYRLSREDTTRPFLTNVRAIDAYRLQVRFSEPVDSASFATSRFTISDTVRRIDLPVLAQVLNRQEPASAMLVLGERTDSAVTYRLRVQGIADRVGNALDTLHDTQKVPGSNVPDTLRPKVGLAGIADSTRNVTLEKPLELVFSKPVVARPFNGAVTLTDSTKQRVPIVLRWLGMMNAEILPDVPLKSRAWYRVTMRLDSLRDVRGNGYTKDSTLRIAFQTMDLGVTGTLAGTVTDAKSGNKTGPIHLTATTVDANPPREKSLHLAGPGRFSFDHLIEGKYTLSAFEDSSNTGIYNYGLPSLFRPSARFVVYPDTVKVRARWGVDGINVRLK